MPEDPITQTGAAAETPGRPKPRRLIIAGVIVALVAVAAIVGVVVISNSDDSPHFAAPQIARMHEGCRQWVDSHEGSNGPDTGWCDSMAGWMNGRMGDSSMMGQDQMMGSMMWQNPTSMTATCEQWAADDSDGANPGTSTGCGQMVDWMEQNKGDWDSWMMDGP